MHCTALCALLSGQCSALNATHCSTRRPLAHLSAPLLSEPLMITPCPMGATWRDCLIIISIIRLRCPLFAPRQGFIFWSASFGFVARKWTQMGWPPAWCRPVCATGSGATSGSAPRRATRARPEPGCAPSFMQMLAEIVRRPMANWPRSARP